MRGYLRRQVETTQGTQLAPLRVLEIDSDDPKEADSGRVSEGRIAVAENPPADSLVAQRYMDHPNGAIDLVESVLSVSQAELADVERRYEKYLGRPAQQVGPTRVFALAGSRVTLVTDADLPAILPGERAPALPAFVAYAVAVRDIGVAEKLLQKNRFPLRVSPAGDLFVPAAAALGAAVIFRAAP